MKNKIWAVIALLFLAAACSSDKKKEEGKDPGTENKTGSTDNKKEPAAMPDSATMMKNWQDYMTPGDMHKMMASWDGAWEGDVTMWMEPGAPEQKSKMASENKMIMNGLYQQNTHSGDMMGMPFNGIGTLGYDNHDKEFVSTWLDNMGTGIMVVRGPWDPATKTMTLKGQMTDPGTKMKCDIRETFQVIDDNTQEMAMYVGMPDGTEFNTMKIRFTRKK